MEPATLDITTTQLKTLRDSGLLSYRESTTRLFCYYLEEEHVGVAERHASADDLAGCAPKDARRAREEKEAGKPRLNDTERRQHQEEALTATSNAGRAFWRKEAQGAQTQ